MNLTARPTHVALVALVVAVVAVWLSPFAGTQETPAPPAGELVVVPQKYSAGH